MTVILAQMIATGHDTAREIPPLRIVAADRFGR